MIKTLFALVMVFTTPKAFALGTDGTPMTSHTVKVTVSHVDGTQTTYDMNETVISLQKINVQKNKTTITDPYRDIVIKVAAIDHQRVTQVKTAPSSSVKNKTGSKMKITVTDTDNEKTRIIAYKPDGTIWKRQYESVAYKTKDLDVKAKAHAKLTSQNFERLFTRPTPPAKKTLGSTTVTQPNHNKVIKISSNSTVKPKYDFNHWESDDGISHYVDTTEAKEVYRENHGPANSDDQYNGLK